jgi:hypothetical protein
MRRTTLSRCEIVKRTSLRISCGMAILGIFRTRRAKLPIVPPAATKFSAARCRTRPSNCHGERITRSSAGIEPGSAGVPNRLRRWPIKVEKAGRKDVASRCFVPGGGLKIWTPPH